MISAMVFGPSTPSEEILRRMGNRSDHCSSMNCHPGDISPAFSKIGLAHFSSKASNLFVRVEQSLLSYDLTGMVPILSSTLHTGLSGISEILAISPAFAICSCQDSLRLYDIKYQSTVAQRLTKQANLKRKRNVASDNGSSPIEFVAYYPQSTRIIGRRHNQLLAIDLTMTVSKKVLETGSDLLHNIGRGVGNVGKPLEYPGKRPLSQNGGATVESGSTTGWEPLRQRLDQLAEAGDAGGFESVLIAGMLETAKPATTIDTTSDDLPTVPPAFSDVKINYLLSKIFQVTSSSKAEASGQSISTKQLKIQLPTLRLILWISRLGLLSSRRVEKAIATTTGDVGQTIPAHAVARALLDADPSCTLLANCLANGFGLYVEEQAAVVQLLIQRALESSEKTIDADLSQVSATMDVDLPFNAVASRVRTSPPSSSEGPQLPESLQGALIAALDRFGTHAGPTISANLKPMFSQTEVLALIQFLRQQLFQAGHTRSFHPSAETESVMPTVRFDAAVKILSGCVDAIGPLGFFGALDNEDFLGNIIPELVAEVTNTKQSLEDVSELQGILREALRYQESIQRHRAAGARIPGQMGGSAAQQRPGAIVTVFSEAVEGEEDLQSGSALPLSLKVEGVIDPAKMRKGGGQVKQRTVRQKRMLERRNKGQYSFERLVL